MKMHVEQTYHIPGSADPVQTCEDICVRDEGAAIAAYELIGASARVIRQETTGDQLQFDLSVHPNRASVPGVIGGLLGYDALDYVQKTTYNFRTHSGVMETVLTHPRMRDKVTSEASFNIRSQAPSAPRTVTWTLDAEVDAHVPFISGHIERTIIKELQARTAKVEAFNQEQINQAVAEAESATEAEAA